MHRTLSMFWAMYKWQLMLIYCIFYMGFEKNLLVDITIALLGLPQHIKLSNARKMMKYGFSLILIFLYLDRISESVGIRENTDTILCIYGKIRIRESLYLGIFHAVSSLDVTGILHTLQIIETVLLYLNIKGLMCLKIDCKNRLMQ